MPTVAVYGSAVNPPHLGHLDVVDQLLDLVDEVVLVPCASHAFGKTMAPFEHRLAMTQALMTQAADPARVRVLDIERQLALETGGKPVYTYNLLARLAADDPRPGVRYVCAFGPDNVRPDVWAKFYRSQDILTDFGRIEVIERRSVRSTLVRDLVAQETASSLVGKIRKFTGAPVAQYIALHGLYQGQQQRVAAGS